MWLPLQSLEGVAYYPGSDYVLGDGILTLIRKSTWRYLEWALFPSCSCLSSKSTPYDLEWRHPKARSREDKRPLEDEPLMEYEGAIWVRLSFRGLNISCDFICKVPTLYI